MEECSLSRCLFDGGAVLLSVRRKSIFYYYGETCCIYFSVYPTLVVNVCIAAFNTATAQGKVKLVSLVARCYAQIVKRDSSWGIELDLALCTVLQLTRLSVIVFLSTSRRSHVVFAFHAVYA